MAGLPGYMKYPQQQAPDPVRLGQFLLEQARRSALGGGMGMAPPADDFRPPLPQRRRPVLMMPRSF